MPLKKFKEVIVALAVITTILQFLSGVLVCKKYIESGTTADSSPLPFISSMLSSSLWLLYGLVKVDVLVILINLIGLLLMLTYTIIFYVYTTKKAAITKLVVLTFGCVLLTIIYIACETDDDKLIGWLGFMACIFAFMTIAAPMTKLPHVYRVKSTECLPFPMIMMNFVVSLFWFFYGTTIDDPYLTVPNLAGALLALCQLSLFVVYPPK